MTAKFFPCAAAGTFFAPPSKSAAHRLLIAAALCDGTSVLQNLPDNDDIAATKQCLSALGATITIDENAVSVRGFSPENVPKTVLCCRDSATTLRLLLPLALLGKNPVTFTGSARLFARGLEPFQDLCRKQNLLWEETAEGVRVCGPLRADHFSVAGDLSSQFASGLLFVLPFLPGSTLEVLPPFCSRSYVELTLGFLQKFGLTVTRRGNRFTCSGHFYADDLWCEADATAAACFAALSELGGAVKIRGLSTDSLQGDRHYPDYFSALRNGFCTINLANNPDLFPILCVLAALEHGAVFCGVGRLRRKESDRLAAMCENLQKCGVTCTVWDDCCAVYGQAAAPRDPLCGYRDHRIIMALSVLLSRLGGTLTDAANVGKSFPTFFEELKKLGIRFEIQ